MFMKLKTSGLVFRNEVRVQYHRRKIRNSQALDLRGVPGWIDADDDLEQAAGRGYPVKRSQNVRVPGCDRSQQTSPRKMYVDLIRKAGEFCR